MYQLFSGNIEPAKYLKMNAVTGEAISSNTVEWLITASSLTSLNCVGVIGIDKYEYSFCYVRTNEPLIQNQG